MGGGRRAGEADAGEGGGGAAHLLGVLQRVLHVLRQHDARLDLQIEAVEALFRLCARLGPAGQ
eukprot:270677-Prymnesium_polylepis.1